MLLLHIIILLFEKQYTYFYTRAPSTPFAEYINIANDMYRIRFRRYECDECFFNDKFLFNLIKADNQKIQAVY